MRLGKMGQENALAVLMIDVISILLPNTLTLKVAQRVMEAILGFSLRDLIRKDDIRAR